MFFDIGPKSKRSDRAISWKVKTPTQRLPLSAAAKLCLQSETIVSEPTEMVEQLCHEVAFPRPIYGCGPGQFLSVVTAEREEPGAKTRTPHESNGVKL